RRVGAGLAHEPDGRMVGRQARESAEQRVVLQIRRSVTKRHSAAVTGVMESRLPGRSKIILASALCVRISARGMSRVFFSARMSTFIQRGASFFEAAS